jgi:tellurite resistance protein TerC
MAPTALLWLIFGLFIIIVMSLDLGVFHRKSHEVHFREAIAWTGVWVALALLFNLGILLWKGHGPALQFLTAYLIEQSLSIDNLFVFLLIFNYYRVPARYQHRVLFWGIIGAIVFRGIFLVLGVTLLRYVSWVTYVFGAFLVFTGIKMAFEKDKEIHPEQDPLMRLLRRWLPVTHEYHGSNFFARVNGRALVTPLFVVLLVVDWADVVFAVDSIPAVLAISTDTFIVFTSNVFAILGLSSLFFVIAGIMKLFHHLHFGLSAILVFVGAKMLLADRVHIPEFASLGVIAACITLSIVASLVWPEREKKPTRGSAA